jgi:hypothetical protein
MGAFFVVVLAPILQFFLGVCKAHEPMSIQTFSSETAVKCSMKALSVGLPGLEKSNVTPRGSPVQ